MSKLEFMVQNLRSELESGRKGANELYDNKNLLTAYRNAIYDIQAYPYSPNIEVIKIRAELFAEEILLRLKEIE